LESAKAARPGTLLQSKAEKSTGVVDFFTTKRRSKKPGPETARKKATAYIGAGGLGGQKSVTKPLSLRRKSLKTVSVLWRFDKGFVAETWLERPCFVLGLCFF